MGVPLTKTTKIWHSTILIFFQLIKVKHTFWERGWPFWERGWDWLSEKVRHPRHPRSRRPLYCVDCLNNLKHSRASGSSTVAFFLRTTFLYTGYNSCTYVSGGYQLVLYHTLDFLISTCQNHTHSLLVSTCFVSYNLSRARSSTYNDTICSSVQKLVG